MSDSVNNNETVQCNCWQYLNYATVTFINEENNNNNININTTERDNNNTILIIQQINSESTSDESNRDKAVQTDQVLLTSQSIRASDIAEMEDGLNHSDPSQFNGNVNGQISSKSVQTNNYEMTNTETLAGNNEETDGIIINNNNGTTSQNSAGSDEQTVGTIDNDNEGNKLLLDNSQINEILNQSEKNKALINSVLKNFTGDTFHYNRSTQNKNQLVTLRDKNPVNQSALKRVLDIIRRESENEEATKRNTVDGFSQTDNVSNHKNTQTVAKKILCSKHYLKKCNLNLDPMGKDLLRLNIEHQNKLNRLYQHYGIDIGEEEEENSRSSGQDEGNAGNVSRALRVASVSNTDNSGNNRNGGRTAVTGNAVKVIDAGNGDRAGNARATDRDVGASNSGDGGSGNIPTTSNNDKAFTNTVNPIPRQGQSFGGDQVPITQAQRPYNANGPTQVRAAGPRHRNDLSTNARYTPYPRIPSWHQDDPRRRPQQHTYECENAQAMHYQNNQHNTMMRQFNGWHTPSAANQVFFPGHHHHHHHF